MRGGTHNPHAPPADFLQQVFLPLLNRMGGRCQLRLLRHGFYPAGGGEMEVSIEPVPKLRPLRLCRRGTLLAQRAEVLITALPTHIAERELATVGRKLGWTEERLHLVALPNDCGPGNVLMITLEFDGITEMFTSFGVRGVRAEKVAGAACRLVRRYQASGAAVGPFLADQLLLPVALAGGTFTTTAPTEHTLTNLRVIEEFLPLAFSIEKQAPDLHQVEVARARDSAPG
jgi:RNA 3'-terminal phosphate cyclase (ATP)